ncbi:MAG: nucleotide exchange factor GrpE [Parcubacteria group bacterium]|nr:nucleotide exchange factor GrpE [Parcubacteria group bacterium]
MENKQKIKKLTPVEVLKGKFVEAEKLRDEYLAGWQRAKADYENLKKGESERASESIRYFNKDWVLRILGLYDNLEMANKHLPDELKDDEWVKAVMAIQNQFLEGIEGLEEIEPIGKKFNPEEHEALEQEEGKEPDLVIEVLQKGYKLDGQVIRPAKVKVSK